MQPISNAYHVAYQPAFSRPLVRQTNPIQFAWNNTNDLPNPDDYEINFTKDDAVWLSGFLKNIDDPNQLLKKSEPAQLKPLLNKFTVLVGKENPRFLVLRGLKNMPV